MIEIESNWPQIKAKIMRLALVTARTAQGPDHEVDQTMRAGIQSHFTKLSFGGSDSALGAGTSSTSVAWTVARNRNTVRSHIKRGVDPRQLMILTGRMKASITSQAQVSGSGTGVSGETTLRSSNPEDAEKLRKNLGGHYITDFPFIAKRRVSVRFPERQVVYWDAPMRDRIVRHVQQQVEKEWRS